VLPHAVRYNRDAGARAMCAHLTRYLEPWNLQRVYSTGKQAGIPMRLADIGMKESGSGARRAHRQPKRLIRTRARSNTSRCWRCCAMLSRGGVRQDEKLVARPGFEAAGRRREALNRGIISPEEDLH